MDEFPTAAGELLEIFRGGAVVLLTVLLSWGIISTKKVCGRCGRDVIIRLDFWAQGNPYETCFGRCRGYTAKPNPCKNTVYYLDTGTILDKRYTKMHIEAKVLLLFTFSLGMPPALAHATFSERKGRPLHFTKWQARHFYNTMRHWTAEYNRLTFHQLGGPASEAGPGVSQTDLQAALGGRSALWRFSPDGFTGMCEADEACFQAHKRQKVRLAMATGVPVRRQTQVEHWVCGCLDLQTNQFHFLVLPRGRSARTRANLCEFLIDACAPCTEVITDSLRAYSSPTLARAGILHTKVNHDAHQYAHTETDTVGNRKTTNHCEALWNRVRRFLATFNLQKQQCTSKRRPVGDLPPLHYYLSDFKFKHDSGSFRQKKEAFEKHINMFAKVLKFQKGGVCQTERNTALFPKD